MTPEDFEHFYREISPTEDDSAIPQLLEDGIQEMERYLSEPYPVYSTYPPQIAYDLERQKIKARDVLDSALTDVRDLIALETLRRICALKDSSVLQFEFDYNYDQIFS